MLGLDGMITRRLFCLLPREGKPIAVTSAIEPGPWRDWPGEWPRLVYQGWEDLESHLGAILSAKRVALEYSPDNGIPYLDRVSGGVLELVRRCGAVPVSSVDLVTRCWAGWTDVELDSHRRSAELLAAIAREAAGRAGRAARGAKPLLEHELRDWLIDSIGAAGLVFESPPIVAAGVNSADVHHDPAAERPRPIIAGDVLLIDLWAKEPGSVYADQTWMAVLGEPDPRMSAVWTAIRRARDRVIELLRGVVEAGGSLPAAEAYRVARQVLAADGLERYAVGRLGHSIGTELHGPGPNLDGLETREQRLLGPGLGFSIEPGLYLPGAFGMRTEVNAFIEPGRLLVTPAQYQSELWLV
ncbi:MAG: M24 family metallopeptidase [Gemmatimonadales bacterium]